MLDLINYKSEIHKTCDNYSALLVCNFHLTWENLFQINGIEHKYFLNSLEPLINILIFLSGGRYPYLYIKKREF